MEISYRKATPADAPQLSQLVLELTDYPADLPALERRLEWMEEHPEYCLTVACRGDQLVGTVTGMVCQDICGPCLPFLVIENVVTREDCRGQGVGKGMFAWLEAWAKEQGCQYAFLVSSSFRKEAHAFYRGIGYTQECGFRKYF